jgi:branched-chain amino acid transport system permease protein
MIFRLRKPDGGWRPALPMALVLAIAAAGLLTANLVDRYQQNVLTTMLCYVGLAQAWNLLAGYGGLISLGVSAFVGSGAYAVALLMIHTGQPIWVALLAALVIGAIGAVLLSVPLLRLRGDYFTIGTLAAALALQAWAFNWDLAGGSIGLSVPIATSPSLRSTYLLAWVVGGVVMLVTVWVAYSTFGMRLRAMRDNEAAAAGLGVSTYRYQLTAFVLCGSLSGLVGGLIAFQQISFEPAAMLGLGWSINALLMAVVGGIGTVVGPVVGTVVVYYLLTRLLASYDAVSLIVEGVLLVVIIRFAPEGLWPVALRSAQGLRRRTLGRRRGAGA